MKLDLKIIDFLAKNPGKEFTINEVSRGLNEYYSQIHKAIDKQVKSGVITKKVVGKSHLCSLNLGNEKALALLQLAEIEKMEELYSKDKELKLILEDFIDSIKPSHVLSITLFGSHAKGDAGKGSDIDILVVGEGQIKIDKAVRECYAKWGKEINAIIVTPKGLEKQRDKALIGEIISNHCVLYGVENFVKLILDGSEGRRHQVPAKVGGRERA
ncbi:hypothetical protein A3K63_02785 [Candidatus Micrarchaeota archaeon RBG_16_49_10]|nr:MAG: hypothetical protein A3K63_02785 [Candidatus Micrarchaeota archaeon RBG_16_49_10]